MGRRGHVLWSTAIVVTACVVGCTPQSAPSPSPSATASPFSSDAEAFAAAEATYRAYVDALNQVSFSDPTTFEAVYALTSGALREADQRSFEQSSKAGMTIEGKFRVVKLGAFTREAQSVNMTLDACLDVSNVRVMDAAGVAQANPTMTAVVPLKLTFEPRAQTSTKLVITNTQPREDGLAC